MLNHSTDNELHYSFQFELLSTRTCFETEANSNSEMVESRSSGDVIRRTGEKNFNAVFHNRLIFEFNIDLSADTAATLISIVSNSYYGMPRGQIHINLPPEHPIMSFDTIEIKMAAVSAKRSMAEARLDLVGST